jgi:hypothetical protein
VTVSGRISIANPAGQQKKGCSDLYEACPTTNMTPSISPLPWHTFSQSRTTTYYGIGQWREVTTPPPQAKPYFLRLKSHGSFLKPIDSQSPSRAVSERATANKQPTAGDRPRPRAALPHPLHLPIPPRRRISIWPLHHLRPSRNAHFSRRSRTKCRPGAEGTVLLLLKVRFAHVISPHNSITHHHELLS